MNNQSRQKSYMSHATRWRKQHLANALEWLERAAKARHGNYPGDPKTLDAMAELEFNLAANL